MLLLLLLILLRLLRLLLRLLGLLGLLGLLTRFLYSRHERPDRLLVPLEAVGFLQSRGSGGFLCSPVESTAELVSIVAVPPATVPPFRRERLPRSLLVR